MAEPEDAGRWRTGAPVHVGSVVVLPIEHVAVHAIGGVGGGWVSALLDPVALVVRDASGLRVVGVGREAPSLPTLRARIAGWDDVLAGL